jgi:tetratricopeptide (TPR) repeat protein
MTARTAAAALLATLLALACAAAPAAATVPHEVAIARGIQLMNDGKYRDALGPLGEALAAAPQNTEALYYAGVAHSRLGEYPEAETLLKRALAVDETSEIQFELGRVAALSGRCGDAEGLFTRAGALGADAATRRAGDTLLEGCRAKGAKRPWRLALTLGWQHDSNVILEPNRPEIAPAGGQSDNRMLAYFNAGATVLHSDAAELGVNYSFYGSRHADLTDYDAAYHKLSVPLSFSPAGRLRPTLAYTLEHTSFGGDKYGLVHTAAAGLGFKEGAATATEAAFEYRWNTYWDSPLFFDNKGRSGTGWSAGARQEATWGPVEGRFQAFYDRDDADEKHWAFTGWHAAARLGWRIADPVLLGGGLEYQARDYRAAPPGSVEDRADRTWIWTANLAWAFTRNFSAALTASHTVNDSNLVPYAYHRTIYGVVLTAAL